MGGAHSVNLVGPKKLSRAAGPLPTKFMADPQWVTTIHNVGGLACILGLRGPNNQVSLTTEERGARFKGASPRARGGKGALAPNPFAAARHRVTTKFGSFFQSFNFSFFFAANRLLNQFAGRRFIKIPPATESTLQVGPTSTCDAMSRTKIITWFRCNPVVRGSSRLEPLHYRTPG